MLSLSQKKLLNECFIELPESEIKEIKRMLGSPELAIRYKAILKVYSLGFEGALNKLKEVEECQKNSLRKPKSQVN